MGGLSFLKNITVKPNSAVKAPTARTSSAEAKNPTNADIRIMKNGAVYPSEKLVIACNLQYTMRNAEDTGNGFDVFSSKDFLNTQHLADAFLFIALVPRKLAKVDLFSSTKFDENDVPTADVLTQGAVTGGLAVLDLIKAAYGIEIPEGQSFIDLRIVDDQPVSTDNNIYFIPKKVSRGEKKGEIDLVRRENLTLYPLVPVQLLDEGDAKSEATSDAIAQQESPQAAAEEIPNSIGSGEPTLSEIEAEAEANETPAPAAALPEGVLNEPEIDETAAGFELEGEIEDADEKDEDFSLD